MENTRLIMLEGLPGTGKSTKSFFLSMQLEREGKPVKWIHEVARPHPVLFFSEASLTYEEYNSILKVHPQAELTLNRVAVFRKSTVGIDLLELEWNYLSDIGMNAFQALQKYDVWTFPRHKYADVALGKWIYFVEKVLEKTEIYILDSSIFQYQIFSFMLKNAPYDELKQFIQKLIIIIKPLNPNLIYLYRDNAEDTINFLEKLRGTQFMESIWERDKNEPYYNDKPTGAEGHKHFLLDYAAIAKQLFDVADCRKKSIEITNQDWETYENEILSFLGAERKSYHNTLPPNGVFRNETLGQGIEVHGLLIKDPYGKERILTPKSDFEFYVECLPVVLRFCGQNQMVISGEQICERWTTSGTLFLRN
jgi:hypothetical protein